MRLFLNEVSGWSLERETEQHEEDSHKTGEKRSQIGEKRDREVATDSFLDEENRELASEVARVVDEVREDEVPAPVFVLESLDD